MRPGALFERRAAAVFAAALACAGLVARTHGVSAQVALRVQAQSRVSVQTRLVEDSLELSGSLGDELGIPLAERALRVQAGAVTMVVQTNARGRFSARLPLSSQRVTLSVDFDGDPHQLPTRLQRTIDTARAQVQLTLGVASTRIDLGAAAHQVSVQASGPGDMAGIALALRDERDRLLASGRTDAGGRARWQLPSRKLGEPGHGRWIVSSEPDATREQAHAELDVVRYVTSQLSLQAQRLGPRALRVDGLLETRHSALAERSVSVEVDGQALRTAQTDALGRFSIELELSTDGPVSLQARYLPEVDWLGASRFGSLHVSALVPATPSALWLLLPLLCCAPALRRLWSRPPAGPRESTRPPAHGKTAGVFEASPRAGRVAVPAISGQVLDEATARPLAEAHVRVRDENQVERELPVDAQGRFECVELPAGQHQLQVDAPGYESIGHALRLPHRGELSGMEIRLLNTRAHLLARFYEAVAAVLPPGAETGRLTPREVGSVARRSDPSHGLLRSLAEKVESAAYARPLPTQAEVATIEADARRVLRPVEVPVPGPKHQR
jgi:hypothetical protein